MRYSFLLVLALFSIPIVAQNNSAQPQQKSNDYVAKLSVPAEEIQLSNGESFRDRLERQGVHVVPGQSVVVMDGTQQSNQCLTMHSIIVRQPRTDSDQVQKRGERTCTMSSQFKFKHASPEEK
jgi:hypothetical protein